MHLAEVALFCFEIREAEFFINLTTVNHSRLRISNTILRLTLKPLLDLAIMHGYTPLIQKSTRVGGKLDPDTTK